MAILSGIGKVHLDGQKGLTKDKPVKSMDAPAIVYIPLVSGTSTAFDVHVQPGDHVDIGTKLATRKDMYVPVYASVSGTVKAIEKRMHISGRMQNHVAIENDGQYTSVKAIDISNPDDMSQSDVLEAIKELGLVGLGGSGFPTYIKYSKPELLETVLINGVECEPFITADHMEMLNNVEALFDGTEFLIKAAGAKNAIIAIKEHKPELFSLLKGECEKHANITCVEVPDKYPMGWERTLVKQVLKKEYDQLPCEVGVVVNNSTTAISLSKGIREGKAITERIVTVSGNGVKEPANVKVAVGTPANEIIGFIGGYIDEEVDGVILNGGPMMGNSLMNDTFVIAPYMNALTVLVREDTVPLPCLKCGMCTDHCPANLQPVKIIQAEKAANVDMVKKLEADRCVSCGMCSYICPSKIEVSDFVAKAKRRLQLANMKKK